MKTAPVVRMSVVVVLGQDYTMSGIIPCLGTRAVDGRIERAEPQTLSLVRINDEGGL